MAKKPATAPKDDKTVSETATTDTAANTGTASTETVLHFADMVYDRDVFNAVATGTNSEAGGAVVLVEPANKLVELGLAEVNPASLADGNIAARLSDRGRELAAWLETDEGKAATAKPARKTRVMSDIKTPTDFSISTVALPIPEAKRGGGSGRNGETYPFGKLDVGHSFHIATTAETQDVLSARLTSSVSTANSRYAEVEHPVGGAKGARYISRAVGTDDPNGIGIRVWREK